MKRDLTLAVVLLFALSAAVLLSRWIDARRAGPGANFGEEQLYLNGPTARRLTLGFNGLAADWYWMRSLQYVGRKIVSYEDTHTGQFNLNDLSTLDLKLLPQLLHVTTTLDPQFSAAYEYGAVILPEVNREAAVSLLNEGIAANPSSWRLYQHLGYIYWQGQDYEKASETYTAGAKLPGAPRWMAAMAARMKADAGSPDAAREMYGHLTESSDDPTVKEMVTSHLLRLDWLRDRDNLQHLLNYARNHSAGPDGRCPSSWPALWQTVSGGFSSEDLRSLRLRIDAATGAPLDPTGVPYRLISDRCEVALDDKSKVPR